MHENPVFGFVDQDILNFCFSKDYVRLPDKFNAVINHEKSKGLTVQRKLYHNAGGGLVFDVRDAFDRMNFEYFCKTPWFNVDTIGKLADILRQVHADRQNFAVKVSSMMSGRTRIFLAEQKNFNALKNIFDATDEEIFIDTNDPNAPGKLFAAMDGKKCCFIYHDVPEVYKNQIRPALIDAGLTEKKDFIDVHEFLSAATGHPFDTSFVLNLI